MELSQQNGNRLELFLFSSLQIKVIDQHSRSLSLSFVLVFSALRRFATVVFPMKDEVGSCCALSVADMTVKRRLNCILSLEPRWFDTIVFSVHL